MLDTHALIWFLEEAPLNEASLFAIAEAQAEKTLFVSPITAWEASLASQKKNAAMRPNLLGQDAGT